MSVITLSRGTFSGGKMLAECLAGRLGYRCVDRDVIVKRAAAYGISAEDLTNTLDKPPTFLERFSHKRYVYLALIQAALTEEVRHGKVIYHGNAGHLLLQGGPPVLRTRIIAPLEFRISMAQANQQLSRNEAIAYIQKVDQQRKKWTQYLYGVDWTSPVLYDIVLNLEYIDIERACWIIAGIVRDRCFEFTPECQAQMDDLALASRIRAELAIDAATAHLEVRVVARGGAVRISGKLSTIDEVAEVRRIAGNVPGVTDLDLDELSTPVLA